MAKDSDGFVRAIARGFAVVEALGRPPGRHTLSEVAVLADINRATARRMLATLVALSRPFRDEVFMQQVRKAPDAAALHRLLEGG